MDVQTEMSLVDHRRKLRPANMSTSVLSVDGKNGTLDTESLCNAGYYLGEAIHGVRKKSGCGDAPPHTDQLQKVTEVQPAASLARDATPVTVSSPFGTLLLERRPHEPPCASRIVELRRVAMIDCAPTKQFRVSVVRCRKPETCAHAALR